MFMDDMTSSHNVFLRPPLWLPILVAAIVGGSYMYGKTIETRGLDQITISVQGEGKVNAIPDIAQLNFGVQTGRQRTAAAAMKMLSEKMNAVFEAVKALGVEEKDITTTGLSLFPSYDWKGGTRLDQGFEASQNLTVRVRDLEKISDVLDAAVRAGANQAGGVSFTIDDPSHLHEEARKMAIADAKEKAQVLAAQLGVTLGEFKGYWEEGGVPPVMPMMERSMAVGMGGGGYEPTPIPAGEQEIRVVVSVTYEVY